MQHEIGKRIKTRRKLLGMTQEELGKIVGVTKAAIGQWESGQIKEYKEDKFDLLAVALEMTREELKTGKPALEYDANHVAETPGASDYHSPSRIVITDKKEIKVIELMRLMADFQQNDLIDTCLTMAKEAVKFKKALSDKKPTDNSAYIEKLIQNIKE